MAWPTKVWDPRNPDADDRGMVPFEVQDPGRSYLKKHGLSFKEYQEGKHDIGREGLSIWDAMENPIYKALAEKDGWDWDEFKKDFNEQVGKLEDQPHSILIKEGTVGGRKRGQRKKEGGWHYTHVPGSPAVYKNFDNYQDAVDWINSNPEDESGREYDFGESAIQLTAKALRDSKQTADEDNTTKYGLPLSTVLDSKGTTWGDRLGMGSDDDYDDDSHFWGIMDSKWTGRFDGWTKDAERMIKRFKRQDAPIIREGPSAGDYGIARKDDNIFAHYGLDKPAEAPKELQWDSYQWNLKKLWTSDVTYAVPPGLHRVNLKHDGVDSPYRNTPQTPG